MPTNLEISSNDLEQLMSESIGITDLNERHLVDQHAQLSWHGTILTSYTLNCG